jgi:FkbM family methyltransferase
VDIKTIPSNSVLGRALRLPLKLIPRSMHVRVIQGPLRGKRWITGSSNAGCWLGTTEQNKHNTFAKLVTHDSVVFDLGANVGHYSLLASILVDPNGKVFCFEPVPRNLEFLRKHLALNKMTNCTVFEAAVGKTEGVGSFDSGPNRFMGHLGKESARAFPVRVVNLDNLVASGELPPPDFIKCDIEGGEFDALSGATNILTKYAPTIFLATHGPEVHKKCIQLLTGLGYRLTSLDQQSVEQTSELLAVHQAK